MVVMRPGRLSIAAPVAVGTAVALATGLEPWSAVGPLWGLTWDAVATLLGLMVLSGTLERAGFFTWCAEAILRLSGGVGPRLWWGLMALACLAAVILANDGAMLILVPLYVSIATNAGFDRRQTLAFLLPACFLIDVASLALSTSNLTNLMVADNFHLRFLTYARLMAAPTAAVVASCLALCWLLFGHHIPGQVVTSGPIVAGHAKEHPPMMAASWLALVSLMMGFVLSHVFSWPVSAVVGAVATALLIVVLAAGRLKPRELGKMAPWSIAIFALGMFVLVDAVARNGGTALLLKAWGSGGSWRVGGSIAVLASGLDNLPAVLMGLLGFAGRPAAVTSPELAAVVVGADIGCKLTPYGSLATLLWFRLLADRGVCVRWREYLPYGLALTPLLWVVGSAAALASPR